MFAASKPLNLLDHFRVPYEVTPGVADERFEQLRATETGRDLRWPRQQDGTLLGARLPANADDAEIPIFARILSDAAARRLLGPRGWTAETNILDTDGNHVGSIWYADDGSIFLPFDPGEVVHRYLSEGYRAISTGSLSRNVRHVAMRGYYALRPLLPRGAQIWMRRRFVQVQARSAFPSWPAEPGLSDFFDFIFSMLSHLAGGHVPRIAAWPGGHTWALVLTHDVEQAEGYAMIDRVLELERSHGARSCWYFVPRRYPIERARIQELSDSGLEVGVHGLYHDGRDLSSLARLNERLPQIRAAAERWEATGFRSPALHRRWEWMPLLGFDYDSSFPDTDPYEPMPGGCCSWLPFFIDELVELPITLPQDHTLFVILRRTDEAVWVKKAELLRERGGMALLDTHPDYLIDASVLRAYGAFLDRYDDDRTAWRALPREVSAWWRRRAASRLERRDGRWEIVGPAAADGRVELAGAPA